jgi:signal transduction histidine kinase
MDPTLDAAPCGFLRLADDGSILLVNAGLAELVGQEADGLVGRHVDAILSAGARIFYQTHVFPLLRLRGRADEIYLTMKAADGGFVPVLLNAVRREGEGSGTSDLVVVPMRQRTQFEDELLQARKAAEEANAARGRFLSMTSHDLRAPLSGISMAAEVLASGASGPVTEMQRHDLARIQEASQYVLRLLSDMLTFARLEAGRADIRREAVEVGELLERVEGVVRHLADRAGLALERGACPPGATVHANPDRLLQVLLNLVTNAIKFTEPGGRVSLTCVPVPPHLELRVEDTGRGIAADRLEHVFELFARVEQASGEREGVGLGLAISRELTRAMGGELTVRSALGQGSTFTVSLPLAQQAT